MYTGNFYVSETYMVLRIVDQICFPFCILLCIKKLIKKVITQGIPIFTVISFPLLQIGLGAFPSRLPKFLYFHQGGAIYIEEYHSSLPVP